MNTPFQKVTFSHEQYMVLEELGRGGMGIVYKCRDRKLLKDVAVKVIGWDFTDEAVIRFHKEATTLAKLHHPNILGVEHFGHSDDDSFFLVMNLLNGRSLSELAEADKHPPFEDALEIFMQICDGLAHAHGKGILHRDIKPSNVFVARYAAGDLQVVITDFGLAKLVADDQSITMPGVTMGSPPYMSPEQCDGKKVDERSDIYSMGCLMFEMLTGTKPFLAETIPHLLMQHITEQPPTLAERAPEHNYPVEMEQIIAKCLAKDPADRYAKAKLLRTDLQTLKDGICNVSFAEHSEESGAYSPSKTFLRTGAFLITGLQNLARPKNEKRFVSILILGVLIVASLVGTGLWQTVMEWSRDQKEKDTLEEVKFKANTEQAGLVLNPTASNREPSRLRETKLWMRLDKDTKKALEEVSTVSHRQLGFVKGEANPDWLDLKGSDVTDDDLNAVTTLKIRGFILKKTGVTDKALQNLSKIDTLEELYLDDTKITDLGLKYLFKNGNEKLNLITLGGTNITDAGVEELSKFGKLAWIGLENCKLVTGANIDLLHNNSDLFHLGLSGSGFKPANLSKLAKVHMASLDISNLNLTDSDLTTISTNKIPGLITLNISKNNEITDQGLLEVAELKGLTSLHIVGCSKISKAGVESFHKARGDRPVAVYTQ